MTVGSDNPFPSILFEEHVDPATPPAGHWRLFVDTDNILKLIDDAGTVSPVGGSSGLTDPMTTRGDLIVRNASNVTARLGRGSAGQVFTSDGTDVAWATPSVGGGGNFGTVQRALVDPTGLTWSWVNQGVASIATSGATLYLSSPAESADNIHMRVKAMANSKPYTEIVHIDPFLFGGNFAAVFVGWLENSTSKFVGFSQVVNSTLVMNSAKSGTNYIVTANYLTDQGAVGGFYKWVALCDDSTNRRIWLSRDGNHWQLLHSVATNDFITPDRIMFGLEARNAANPISLLVDSVETHTGSTP